MTPEQKTPVIEKLDEILSPLDNRSIPWPKCYEQSGYSHTAHIPNLSNLINIWVYIECLTDETGFTLYLKNNTGELNYKLGRWTWKP